MAEWFKDWFASDQYLNVYKHRDESDAIKLLTLISQHISIPKDKLILDAACGAGRYTNLLLKSGYKAIGFDLSLPLLKKAKLDLEQSDQKDVVKENVYFRTDIRSVGLKKKFILILNVFTSFGYFNTDNENFRFIRDSVNFLRSDGYFVFDYLNKHYVINNLVEHSEKQTEDYLVRETRSIKENKVVKEIELEKDNQTKQFVESVALYSDSDIQKVFEAAGYKLLNKFGDYEGSEFNEQESSRLIMVLKNEN